MNVQPQVQDEAPSPLPRYDALLLAADSSDHANRGIREAVALAGLWGGRIVGTHVYAAKMHDARFRQMEGGLPDQYRKEQELERQRDVHDDLITRGLSVISDSYLDQVDRACSKASVSFERCHLEGKNYRQLANEANSGNHDLLIMGALGLGAVEGSRLGTVCQRVARLSAIDTLVIKDPEHSIAEGPIMVAVDGSARAYGGLLSALALASQWNVPVQVVAAFDPYYHYVAFNRIADVLSEEAGKVFRFKEQEKLHEEIIDSGLAKIYEGHLNVAKGIADDYGINVATVLLDGKPHDAIECHARKIRPSLLVIGKIGIHADADLDIGGNAENLLRNVDCAVLLSQREHTPRVDRVAAVTTSWTDEAEQRMQRVPSFVRDMARMAILRYAQERGHTVVTERIVDEATAKLMPGRAEQFMSEVIAAREGEPGTGTPDAGTPMQWSAAARTLLDAVADPALRDNLMHRIEKKARIDGATQVEPSHAQGFLDTTGTGARPDTEISEPETALYWEAPALARLMRVPEGFMRDSTRSRIEDYAHDSGVDRITLEVAERGREQAKQAMRASLENRNTDGGDKTPRLSRCPFANPGALFTPAPEADTVPAWTQEALALLERIPDGYCRDMTAKAAQAIASQTEAGRIDSEFVAGLMKVFEAGSSDVSESMPWDEQARARIARAPDMVRGMLVREIEAWARRAGRDEVDGQAVDAVKKAWRDRGVFHLDPEESEGPSMSGNGRQTRDDAQAPALYLLAINLTRRCNLACAHCYLDAGTRCEGDADELITSEVHAVLDQVASRGDGPMVVLTGGEPLLRRDIEAIVAHGAGLGLAMVIGTNGMALTDGRVRSLMAAGALGAGISVDSLDPDRHDRFRGAPGAWSKTMGGIEACRRAGWSFQIHFSVTEDNAEELPAMIDFARTVDARALNVFFLVCTGRGESMSDISPARYEHTLNYLVEAQGQHPDLIIRARCAPHFKRVAHQRRPDSLLNRIGGGDGDGCIAGTHYCRITPDGDVTACPYIETSAGNVRELPFLDIWDSSTGLWRLRTPKLNGRCGACEYGALCGGCRARALAASGNLMDEDPVCAYTPAGGPVIVPISDLTEHGLRWSDAANERLARVPPFLRRLVKKRAEAYAAECGEQVVTTEHLSALVAKRFGGNAPRRPELPETKW